jgi:hypothetical protein
VCPLVGIIHSFSAEHFSPSQQPQLGWHGRGPGQHCSATSNAGWPLTLCRIRYIFGSPFWMFSIPMRGRRQCCHDCYQLPLGGAAPIIDRVVRLSLEGVPSRALHASAESILLSSTLRTGHRYSSSRGRSTAELDHLGSFALQQPCGSITVLSENNSGISLFSWTYRAHSWMPGPPHLQFSHLTGRSTRPDSIGVTTPIGSPDFLGEPLTYSPQEAEPWTLRSREWI